VGQRVPARSSTQRVRGDDGYSEGAPREDRESVRMEYPVSTP
jgi:hypothetical protein